MRTPTTVRMTALVSALGFIALVLVGGPNAVVGAGPAAAASSAAPAQPAPTGQSFRVELPREAVSYATDPLPPAELFAVSVALAPDEAGRTSRTGVDLRVVLGEAVLEKRLHAGDPSFFATLRMPSEGIEGTVETPVPLASRITLDFQPREPEAGLVCDVEIRRLALAADDQAAFECEPNDDWRHANPIPLGRPIYGSCDDIEYLDNQREYEVGWDWFRIDFEGVPSPSRGRAGVGEDAADHPHPTLPHQGGGLVFFEIDLPDRDIPVQLVLHRLRDDGSGIEPYERGKDPMEVLHDGQHRRYSKFITRVLEPGTYFLQVLGNHPAYTLRTTVYPVPPYDDPEQAVTVAMHYMACIGDAWFAQIPRLGARYRRSIMLHDEATRCTACHPTVFPLESNLTAFANGYDIPARSQFDYLMQRVYNAPTPLYGNEGVNWVRFVGIQLQFFGKQGGLVMDYERLVTGEPTELLGRYTGFLQAAWDHRSDLPNDEPNGVSPIDSKFGFAWRDWRVLDEWARRTGDPAARASADHLRDVFLDPAAAERVQGTQDRLHRLYGLALMDPEGHADEIRAQVAAILAEQNPDGGWPGNREWNGSGFPMSGTESVEYVTAQTLHTLLVASANVSAYADARGTSVPPVLSDEQRPQLERAAAWLLSRQDDFGGWFQTETAENFVTPLRETRYAIMALSTLYPRGQGSGVGDQNDAERERRGDAETGRAAVVRGLGNRDGRRARLPRSDGGLLALVDDLDNLMDVPAERAAEFVAAIAPLMEHEHAIIRQHAAMALGRIEHPDAVEPLVAALDDPVKCVWQAAAWALRRIGNRGRGHEAILSALRSGSPATRRGAARIFAYQFYGMDRDNRLLEAFFPLLADPDLLTRHQAAETLSQWWYRTADFETRRRIFTALIDRLADQDEHPLQRFMLSQAVYNLLDENLGGSGTGYARWIAYFEPQRQEALRAERRRVEQGILLPAVLHALREGPPQQRLGVLLGFDGTPFWRGYTTAAFGPGNDRDFDFESGVAFDGLAETFAALFADAEHPENLRYALLLGAFFQVFQGDAARDTVPLYLLAVTHPDAQVREAAASIVDRVELAVLEADPAIRSSAAAVLARAAAAESPPESRRAALELLRRRPQLLAADALPPVVRAALSDEEWVALALPLAAEPVFSDEEAFEAVQLAWPRELPRYSEQESASFRELIQRNSLLSPQVLEGMRRTEPTPPPQVLLDALNVLRRRTPLLESTAVLGLLIPAAQAQNGLIRSTILGFIGEHEPLVTSELLAPLLRDGLLDPQVEVRRLALGLVTRNTAVWESPDTTEHLLQLVVDPDAQVRRLAVALIAERDLVDREPRLAGRLRAIMLSDSQDAELRAAAEQALRDAGLDPESIDPTVDLAGELPELDFAYFVERINPYFYEPLAADQRSCANCHATHRILRLAEPPDVSSPPSELCSNSPASEGGVGGGDRPPPVALTEDELRMNYESLLRVVDRYEPEMSLVLRKPRSPSGQGDADAASPTGLTHVGGTRWDSTDHPAYQAILRWLRGAAETGGE